MSVRNTVVQIIQIKKEMNIAVIQVKRQKTMPN